jgi:hypothetical protein
MRHGLPKGRPGPVPTMIVCLIGAMVIAGCGGSDSPDNATSAPTRVRENSASMPRPLGERAERYRPGDPACRPREAPGTVDTIGEDIASGAVRVQDFVACFGPPTRRTQSAGRDCLLYRQRGQQTYWRFCARDGRIVGALSSLRPPG